MSKRTERGLIVALVMAVLLVIGLAVALIVVATKKDKDIPDAGTTTSSSTQHSGTTSMSQQQNGSYNGNPYEALLKQDTQASAAIGQQLFQEIANNGPMHLQNSLRTITKKVHVAGTDEQMEVLQYLKDTYTSYGLEVINTDYNVMLSYPDYNNPNSVSMQLPDGSWTLVSTGLGDIPSGPPELVAQIGADKKAPNWWNAFGANGTGTGRLVYANYGSVADFQYLESNNISLNGAIVVIRYGNLFRGDKVQEAEKRGVVGVILYSDPIDYGSPNLNDVNNTFPNSVFMPPGGAQRGTVLQTNGDPLTPLYPSKPYTHRIDVSDVDNNVIAPKIPVMPIGYRDAVKLFQNMNGAAVPDGWAGGIQGINYTLTSSVTFKITVNAVQDTRRKISNVIAFMRGSVEPDQYVLLINHVDAWTFGAMDPNSGTAAILEAARALTTVSKANNWRPRRTIVFCSVDAEEFGLVGSTEFVEEYLKVLQQRAVALVNTDVAVSGTVVLDVEATPSLYQSMIRAAKLIPNPNANEANAGRKTMYDSWMYYYSNGSFVPGQPQMLVPDSGSDHSGFLSFAGVPAAALGYDCDPSINRECYELYHTMFEVSWTYENLIDPGYNTLIAMTQYWTEIIRDLSDTLIIPFDLNDYATVLKMAISQLDDYMRGKQVPGLLASGRYSMIISNLQDAATRFAATAAVLQTKVDAINSGQTFASLRQVEMLNSRLMGLERAFVNDRGIYSQRKDARHVLFATSIHDQYSGTLCAGVYDSVEYYFETGDPATKADWLKSIEVTLSEVQYGIESAILLLDITDY